MNWMKGIKCVGASPLENKPIHEQKQIMGQRSIQYPRTFYHYLGQWNGKASWLIFSIILKAKVRGWTILVDKKE